MKPLLTICIPTVEGREFECERLIHALEFGSTLPAEYRGLYKTIIESDNKELTIGAKRQKLLERVSTDYLVMIDDDDEVPPYYLYEVLGALQLKPDCIGYLEQIINLDGTTQIACHSDRWPMWGSAHPYTYVRTIFHKDPIKTEIARQIGFNKELRYSEDHDFSMRLKVSGLIKKEVFIDKIMYFYNSPGNLTKEQSNERYGIK